MGAEVSGSIPGAAARGDWRAAWGEGARRHLSQGKFVVVGDCAREMFEWVKVGTGRGCLEFFFFFGTWVCSFTW